MNVIDLFCGAGGFSKGFKDAGFNILLGIDNQLHKQITYYTNIKPKYSLVSKSKLKPIMNNDLKVILDGETKKMSDKDKILICGITYDVKRVLEKNKLDKIIDVQDKCNIANLTVKSILSKIKNENIDVIIGSPPCKDFSIANTSSKVDTERAELYKEYFRIVRIVRPIWIVMENVLEFYETKDSELLKVKLEEIGYKIRLLELNAKNYGVPQNRERGFLVGVLSCENLDINIPKSYNNFVNIRSAISDLESNQFEYDNKFSECTEYQQSMRLNIKKKKKVNNHNFTKHNKDTVEQIKKYKERFKKSSKEIEKYGQKTLISYDSIASVITNEFDNVNAKGFSIHPGENVFRTLTCREAARLQSFPDDFEFYGTRDEVTEQIGDAVAPLVAKAIAEMIKESTEFFRGKL